MPNAGWRRLRPIAAVPLAAALLAVGSAVAWAATEITIDFVRHGEAGDNLVINNEVPGPGLTEAGQQQADVIAQVLKGDDISAIFASGMTRAQETAGPLADALGMNVTDLSGLNEIDAGIFAGMPVNIAGLPIGAAAYSLAPAAWALGLYFVPQLGLTTDVNGMAFEDRYSGAVQDIYDTSHAGGTDAVFSHEAAIAFWTLMNVKNPDFPLMLEMALSKGELLPYTGVVEVQGSPADGWTLVSWDGQDVPANPGLPTELFVDFRDLITVPQLAAWHVWETLPTGDLTEILAALQTGFDEIDAATIQFPVAVIDDIAVALSDPDPAILFPAATDLIGQLLG